MNEAGDIAFRATLPDGRQGVFLLRGEVVERIATSDEFGTFHGLPVVNDNGVVAFCAEQADGELGIFACSAGSVSARVRSSDGFHFLGRFPTLDRLDRVVFVGARHGREGVFRVDREGVITTLVDDRAGFRSFRGALGSVIDDFALSPVSMDCSGVLAFRLHLAVGRGLIGVNGPRRDVT